MDGQMPNKKDTKKRKSFKVHTFLFVTMSLTLLNQGYFFLILVCCIEALNWK